MGHQGPAVPGVRREARAGWWDYHSLGLIEDGSWRIEDGEWEGEKGKGREGEGEIGRPGDSGTVRLWETKRSCYLPTVYVVLHTPANRDGRRKSSRLSLTEQRLRRGNWKFRIWNFALATANSSLRLTPTHASSLAIFLARPGTIYSSPESVILVVVRRES